MTKRPDGSTSRTRVVSFTRDAADRIAKTVRDHESGNRNGLPMTTHPRMSGGGGGKGGIVSKTQSLWSKGTSQELYVYKGEPPNEQQTDKTVTAWNKFTVVEPDKWVFLSFANGHWYLVAAECD